MQTNIATYESKSVPSIASDRGFYSMKEVCEMTRFSRTHIYRMEAAGLFPRRRKLCLAKIGFVRAEVDDWLKNRPFANLLSEDNM